MKTWFAIAALAAVWIVFRRRRGDASPGLQDGDAVDVPSGTNIGQIGSRIENPQALTDFASALEAQSAPRVVFVEADRGNWIRQIWSDGRVTITDGAGNVLTDTPYRPNTP